MIVYLTALLECLIVILGSSYEIAKNLAAYVIIILLNTL